MPRQFVKSYCVVLHFMYIAETCRTVSLFAGVCRTLIKEAISMVLFLGPRGPLREPMSVVVVAARKVFFSTNDFTINHYIIMSDLSDHIFSESS